MAYITGTANSFADLLTALRSACTANGWTLAGDVLSKGGCYAEVLVGTTIDVRHTPNASLALRAGNGIDGANALTDAVAVGDAVHLGVIADRAAFTDWDWPVTYHIHVLTAPDEVYLLVNYGGGQYWQQLGWGKSPAAGNAGSGNWCSATMGAATATGDTVPNEITISPSGGSISPGSIQDITCLPFFWGGGSNPDDYPILNSRIHGAINSVSGAAMWSDRAIWLGVASATEGKVSAAASVVPLLGYTPNVWNNETVLLPVQVLQERASAKVSLIGELQHSRYARNDYLVDGAVVTLGSDRWKVYPAYRKDAVNRDGGAGITHSGTMALAVRYDGP